MDSLDNILKLLDISNEVKISILIAVFFTSIVFQGVYSTGNLDSSEEMGEFNQADVKFLSMMSTHHEQAIEMANLAPERTENERVLEIAENISQFQHQEIHTMQSWLNQSGLERPERTVKMAGMASSEEIQKLENSEDRDFDLLFTRLMIDHHVGGIQMAESVVQNGRSERIEDIAQNMVEAQQKEVNMMKEWRNEWS